MILLITEIDEPFSGADGAFKSSVKKLIPICGLLPIKKNSMGYGGEWSYK